MAQSYNVYCDESCHLENDHLGVMLLGAVWCPTDKVKEVMTRIKEIKARYSVATQTEVKWVKISPKKLPLYLELVDYFFDDDDLHFRALIVPEKDKLDHAAFQQEHDDWYFKMYFDMIKILLGPKNEYRIFPDIKDSRSSAKVAIRWAAVPDPAGLVGPPSHRPSVRGGLLAPHHPQGSRKRREAAGFPACRAAALVWANHQELR